MENPKAGEGNLDHQNTEGGGGGLNFLFTKKHIQTNEITVTVSFPNSDNEEVKTSASHTDSRVEL